MIHDPGYFASANQWVRPCMPKPKPDARCKNCGEALHGRFCSSCGQKVYTAKDDSVRGMATEALHFITHFEGKFLTTVRTIFCKPGQLSVDHANGMRQRYYKPISLFLMLVVLYLLFPLFQGLNMRMTTYEHIQAGSYFTAMIDAKAEARGLTVEEVGERFDHRSGTTSKALLLLLIPLTAPILRVLLIGKKRRWYHDLVLATEVNAFYLLAFYLIAPLVVWAVILIVRKEMNEEILGMALLALFTVYGAVLMHRVQREARWRSALKGLALAVTHTLMLTYLYKPLLFLVTMALI